MEEYFNQVVYEFTMKIDNSIKDFIVKNIKIDDPLKDEFTFNMNKITTAIKKQIPMKPVAPPHEWSRVFSCGRCGHGIVDTRVNHTDARYCEVCGQKIDWSDAK